MIWIVIAVGGAGGAVARYFLTSVIASNTGASTTFPLGTLAVNVIGCLLAGTVVGAASHVPLSGELRAFLLVGLLGGFTTFSAFSIELLLLLQNGHVLPAIAYLLSSVLVALFAAWAGFALTS